MLSSARQSGMVMKIDRLRSGMTAGIEQAQAAFHRQIRDLRSGIETANDGAPGISF